MLIMNSKDTIKRSINKKNVIFYLPGNFHLLRSHDEQNYFYRRFIRQLFIN